MKSHNLSVYRINIQLTHKKIKEAYSSSLSRLLDLSQGCVRVVASRLQIPGFIITPISSPFSKVKHSHTLGFNNLTDGLLEGHTGLIHARLFNTQHKEVEPRKSLEQSSTPHPSFPRE